MANGVGPTGAAVEQSRRSGFFIIVDPDHKGFHEAFRLLLARDGRRFHPAIMTLFGYATASERDDAIEEVRKQMGWTAACAFDGRPYRMGDP